MTGQGDGQEECFDVKPVAVGLARTRSGASEPELSRWWRMPVRGHFLRPFRQPAELPFVGPQARSMIVA